MLNFARVQTNSFAFLVHFDERCHITLRFHPFGRSADLLFDFLKKVDVRRKKPTGFCRWVVLRRLRPVVNFVDFDEFVVSSVPVCSRFPLKPSVRPYSHRVLAVVVLRKFEKSQLSSSSVAQDRVIQTPRGENPNFGQAEITKEVAEITGDDLGMTYGITTSLVDEWILGSEIHVFDFDFFRHSLVQHASVLASSRETVAWIETFL